MSEPIQAFLRSNPLFAGLPAREVDRPAAVARSSLSPATQSLAET